MIDYSVLVLYLIGVSAFLTTYLPFSPMTIDLVNLQRDNQLNIFRYRKLLWATGAICFVSVVVIGFSTDNSGWFWITLVTAAMLLFMFWTGYVPWVMAPPHGQQIIEVEEANRLLDSSDVVLGIYHGNEARAYPRDLIARPHFLTDTVGGTPLIISYCILCNSAVAFVSELNRRPLELDCVTAYNNNIIYRDKHTGNIIQQLDGQVIEGPDSGASLESLPLTVATWDEWRRLHPESKVCYAPAVTFRDKMVGWMLEFLIPISKLSKRATPWHRVRGELDARLPAMSYVFGVELGNERCAFPESFLREHPAHNDIVGGQPIVTFYSRKGDYGGVFERVLEGNVLNFRAEQSAKFGEVFVDEKTGSSWNIAGEAIDGELSGKTLTAVPHFNKIFWFGWSLFKPGTKVVHHDTAGGVAAAPD